MRRYNPHPCRRYGKGREVMESREQFRAGLARLRETASAQMNHVTIADILACFPGMELTKEQIRLIYEYAEEEHIVIENYTPKDTRSVSIGKKTALTGEEKAVFQMYLNDLRSVSPCSEEEAELLAQRLIEGDDMVIVRLTEGHLHLVLEIAREHAGRGVLIGDLVQEGNVELMLALNDLLAGGAILAGGLRTYLTERIGKVMKRSISELADHRRTGERVARETNRLLAATLDFEEEYGREATLEELAEKVGLPQDTVRELIQISLDAAALGDRADGNESPING